MGLLKYYLLVDGMKRVLINGIIVYVLDVEVLQKLDQIILLRKFLLKVVVIVTINYWEKERKKGIKKNTV